MSLLTSCSESPAERRDIILGFDGMDPVIVSRLMDEGLLPNFSKLRDSGYFAPLPTSNPPQSPVAWSSFITEQNPGAHGIFDFLRANRQTYTPDFSISEQTPAKTLDVGGWRLPISGGQLINRRQGTAFWSEAEQEGQRATVLRVPVTYPPEPIHRMMSGMGVPDLLGTQGTYSYYSTAVTPGVSTSARVIRLRTDQAGNADSTFEGPINPLRAGGEALTTPLRLEPQGQTAVLTLGEETETLTVGKWSRWLRVSYKVAPLTTITGTVRAMLVSTAPELALYVSPIQIDPANPAIAISEPVDYAAELAAEFGLFHTIGMPEETWSLSEGHLSDAAWLEMEKTILAEREAMYFDALDRRDSELVVSVFVQTDRVSHMFYRGIDPEHPLHESTDEAGRQAIAWIYGEADRIVGETLKRMGPEDRLVVMSDHGFTPFRRAFHLNRWLVDNGYLTLVEGADESDIGFGSVDWSKSRAYALGLNGLFINQQGRENQGTVPAGEAKALAREIGSKLKAQLDPKTGQGIVRRVFSTEQAYGFNPHPDAPDLVIGYDAGYRASWETTLGAIPAALVEDNTGKWSGDHCVDPELVPGVFFASFPVSNPPMTIAGVYASLRFRHSSTGP
ncbi:MAG: alkaline phosphatase family protein [Pseudomonadota bacterium]